MKRAKEHRPTGPASKRDKVVSAAARLFLQEGYGTTGMDTIAEEAGVSKATLYSYYKDKASLFADVMTQVCDEVGDHDVEALVGDSLQATLEAAALYGVQRVLQALDRAIVQRVVAESREFPELGRRFWEAGPGPLEAFVAATLARADKDGELVVKDPARAATRFVGQVTGLYLLPMLVGARSRPTEKEMRRDLDELVSGFLAALRAGPGT